MGDDLEQLKTVFRSLVVSSPTQVNVCSLLHDYRSMIGAPVPITKYGYRNPVEFLKEKFSDCFLFSGSPSNPILTLIVPKSLKHIDNFVQKQRNSSKFHPKRRSVPAEIITPLRECFKAVPSNNNLKSLEGSNSKSHQPSREIKKKCRQSNNASRQADELCRQDNKVSSKPLETNMRPDKETGKPNRALAKSKEIVNKFNEAFHKPKETLKETNEALSTSSETQIKSLIVHNTSSIAAHNDVIDAPHYYKPIKNNENDPDSESGNSSNALNNFFKKRLPLSQYLDEERKSPESFNKLDKFIHDDESVRPTTFNGSSAKTRQLEELKMEITQLICDAPEGVWCTELIRLYRERYNRELNFIRFGYTSIISLVYCLEDVVQITPVETGDWLLQERSQATPAPPAPRPRPRHLRSSHSLHSSRHFDPEDALPGIDFDPDVFPEDCMQFMESIDSVSLEDFCPGAMVEVIIGEVYSPSHFWFIRVGEDFSFAMEDMMDEMTQYYNNDGRDRVLARGAIRVGHYCSSLFERDWHRSLIVKIVDSETVKVRHVDYGTVDTVSTAQLKPLRRQWGALPAQAARARLAAVRPPAAGLRWTHAACAAFLAHVTDRHLVANVVAHDHDAHTVEMLLIDTSSAEDVCIGTQLVRAGHADTRADSALRTPDVHLYPRFEALENGDTPNFAEIRAFLRDGIALDYVHEYRAHVPHVLPEPSLSTGASSPPTPPTPCATELAPEHNTDLISQNTDLTSQPQLPTRIPLLLPDRPQTPHSAPMVNESDSKSEAKMGRSSAPALTVRSPLLPPPLPPQVPPPLPPQVPCASYPPPPYVPSPGVTLSLAECETYHMLSHVNPEAAYWFIAGAIGRAMSLQPYTPGVPVQPPHLPQPMPVHPPHLTPQIPMHPPYPLPHMAVHPPPPHMPPHVPMHTPMNAPCPTFYTQMRPPPGFGF